MGLERWKLNVVVLWFGQIFVMSGMTMIIPFLPLYLQFDLGLTDPHEIAVWSGLIFAGTFVTSFIFQPIWGKVADRYGRKMMLLRSGFGMSVVIILMGFSQTPWHLLLLRIANGTISGFIPAATALVAATTPKNRVGFAMGTLQSGSMAGSLLGPFIGGLLADWIGFRPIFYITGALIFTATMLALLIIKESFNREAAASRPQASVLQGFRQLGKIPQLSAMFTVTLLIQFAMAAPMALIPLYVQKLHGSTENLAFLSGFVGSVTGMSNMIAAPFLGRWGDKYGSGKILAASLLGASVVFVPHAMVNTVWQLLIIRFILGIFMAGLLPSVNALIRKYTPDGMESRAYSFNTSAMSLGNMLGPIVGGALSGWAGIEGVFIFTAALLFLNVFWLRQALRRSRPTKASA
mgnify:CR=1 FL=1